MKIAVAGAGSIGCYCGALLASAGHDVTLLGRARVLEAIRAQGLTVTDFSGLRRTAPAAQLTLAEDPLGLSGSDLVLVTVKSGATAKMATLIAAHAAAAGPGCVVAKWIGKCPYLAHFFAGARHTGRNGTLQRRADRAGDLSPGHLGRDRH